MPDASDPRRTRLMTTDELEQVQRWTFDAAPVPPAVVRAEADRQAAREGPIELARIHLERRARRPT